jgi:hypothetical protein
MTEYAIGVPCSYHSDENAQTCALTNNAYWAADGYCSNYNQTARRRDEEEKMAETVSCLNNFATKGEVAAHLLLAKRASITTAAGSSETMQLGLAAFQNTPILDPKTGLYFSTGILSSSGIDALAPVLLGRMGVQGCTGSTWVADALAVPYAPTTVQGYFEKYGIFYTSTKGDDSGNRITSQTTGAMITVLPKREGGIVNLATFGQG